MELKTFGDVLLKYFKKIDLTPENQLTLTKEGVSCERISNDSTVGVKILLNPSGFLTYNLPNNQETLCFSDFKNFLSLLSFFREVNLEKTTAETNEEVLLLSDQNNRFQINLADENLTRQEPLNIKSEGLSSIRLTKEQVDTISNLLNFGEKVKIVASDTGVYLVIEEATHKLQHKLANPIGQQFEVEFYTRVLKGALSLLTEDEATFNIKSNFPLIIEESNKLMKYQVFVAPLEEVKVG